MTTRVPRQADDRAGNGRRRAEDREPGRAWPVIVAEDNVERLGIKRRLDDRSLDARDAYSLLRELSRVGHEGELNGLLRTCISESDGALAVRMVTRDAERPQLHPMLTAFDRSDDDVIPLVGPILSGHLRRGAPLVLVLPEAGFDELGLPKSARLLAVLPCSGAESRHALCVAWSDQRRDIDDARLAGLAGVAAAGGLALDRIDASRRENMRSVELESRLRGLVGTIRRVASASAERAESMDAYRSHFSGRLDALARAQVSFARSGPARSDLELLVREELLAQGIRESSYLALHGMPVLLYRREAEAMSLAVHELATNAIKFGPVVDEAGGLTARWWLESGTDGPVLQFVWREFAVDWRPETSDRVGFGRHYIERVLPNEFGATTEFEIGSSGMRCKIALPLAQL